MVQITTNISRYTSDAQAQTYVYENGNINEGLFCIMCNTRVDPSGNCACGGSFEVCACSDCGASIICGYGCSCQYFNESCYCSNCNSFYNGYSYHNCSSYNGPCYCYSCYTSYDCNYGHTCDSGGGGSGTPPPSTPPPAPTLSPMGDPIDPLTGLPNVTTRFNEDIRLAFEQFCGSAYPFNAQVNSYGNLMEGIFSYPQDYINYMEDFINQVKGGAPWDLKADYHGYSKLDLGSEKAIYNGQEYNFDDFGNITFGIAAAAYGFPIDFSKAGAGFYQIYSGTSEWSYISSYFDAPRDQEMIEEGYSIFYNNGGCTGNSF